MSTLYAEETDTSCMSTTAGSGDGYNLHVHTAGGGEGYILHTPRALLYTVERDKTSFSIVMVVDRDTPCNHTLLVVDRDTPCTFILLVVDRDTSCTFTLLVVEKETPYKSALWWRKGYICTSKVRTGMPGKQLIRYRHFFRRLTMSRWRRHSGIRVDPVPLTTD